jgi:hypothetical protein
MQKADTASVKAGVMELEMFKLRKERQRKHNCLKIHEKRIEHTLLSFIQELQSSDLGSMGVSNANPYFVLSILVLSKG